MLICLRTAAARAHLSLPPNVTVIVPDVAEVASVLCPEECEALLLRFSNTSVMVPVAVVDTEWAPVFLLTAVYMGMFKAPIVNDEVINEPVPVEPP